MGRRRAQKNADLSVQDFITPTFSPQKVETGILGLDALLDGGLPYGSVVVLGGKEDIGKTNLALSIVANVVKQGYHALYIDVENRLLYNQSRFTYKRLTEEELKRIEIFPGENAVETVAAHIRARLTTSTNPIKVVVIDSLASLHTRSFRLLRAEMQQGGVGMGAVARAITDELKDLLTYYAHTKQVLFVITTQLRTSLGGGPHMEMYGARYIRHAAATIIRLSPISKPTINFDDPIPPAVTVGGIERPTFQYLNISLEKCQLSPWGVRAGVIARMFLISAPKYGIFLGDYDNIFQLILYGRRRPYAFIERRGDTYKVIPTGTTFTLREAYTNEELRKRIIEECKPHLYQLFKTVFEDAFTQKLESDIIQEESEEDVPLVDTSSEEEEMEQEGL